MSRNQKLYDDDDMYDYDDYDDDYVAPPKSKAKSKAVAGKQPNNTTQPKTTKPSGSAGQKQAPTTNNSIKIPTTNPSSQSSIVPVLANTPTTVKVSEDSSNTSKITSSLPTHTIALNDISDDEIDKTQNTQGESLPKVSIVITGHVDAGKSTLLGNLLVQVGSVAKRTVQKYQKESEQVGKGSFALAWVMDESKAERAHGVTIDLAERLISTTKRHITLIDSPGHRDFVPAMISGAGQADAAILVVPATEGEFESSMGPQAQTREHARLLSALGIETVIIAVNKMDRTNPDPWIEARFRVVESAVQEMMIGLSFKSQNLVFVPTSGLAGENLTSKSEAAAWYAGPTLLEAMDSVDSRNAVGATASLRAVVTAVASDVSGKGFEVSVSVLRGRLRINRRVGIPLGSSIAICTVKKIVRHHSGDSADLAAWEHVTVTLVENASAGRSASELGVREGVCLYKGPPVLRRVKKFRATIQTGTQLDAPIIPGTRCAMYIHSFEAECVIAKLISTATSARVKCLPSDCTAEVELTCDPPVAIEPVTEFAPFGLFILRNRGKTIATGRCQEIIEFIE